MKNDFSKETSTGLAYPRAEAEKINPHILAAGAMPILDFLSQSPKMSALANESVSVLNAAAPDGNAMQRTLDVTNAPVRNQVFKNNGPALTP